MRKLVGNLILGLLLIMLFSSVAAFAYGIVFPSHLADWMGTKGYTDPTGKIISAPKTLWDLMSLLIVPVALAIVAFLLNSSERNAEARRAQKDKELERERSDDQHQEDALREYIAKISDLIIENDLLRSDEDSPIRIVARTYTRVTVHRLNGKRRGSIARFLKEARLLDLNKTIIRMAGADLREADLENADLSELNLFRVNLSKSNLDRTNLTKTNLIGANISSASIRNASLGETLLSRANLTNAVLTESKLTKTNMIRAILVKADLSRAVLIEVKLNGADLSGANLCGSKLKETVLNGVKLTGAHADSITEWPTGFDYIAAGVTTKRNQ